MCQGSIGAGELLTQVATIGHTMTFSPTFLWDAVLGWTRQGQEIRGIFYGQQYGLDVLQIPGTNGKDIRESGAPMFPITGYSIYGGDTDTRPFFMHDTTFITAQNFGLTRPKHDIRFGFEGGRHHLNHYSPDGGGHGGPQGRFEFTSGITGLRGGPSLTQFNAYAAYLLGLPEIMRKARQYDSMTGFDWQFAWYIRDRWRVTDRLTLSMGVRYELYPMLTRAGRGGIETWDPQTNLIILGGIGGNPKGLGIGTSHKLFAPRLGIAYRMNNATVIRTGYGITYNPMPLARPLRDPFPLTTWNLFQSPNSFQPFRPIEQGIPELVPPDISAGKLPLPTVTDMRIPAGNTINRGYVQSWNFIVERQMPGQVIATVGYVGSQTVRSFAGLRHQRGRPRWWQCRPAVLSEIRPHRDDSCVERFPERQLSRLTGLLQSTGCRSITLKGAYTYSKAFNMTDEDGRSGLMFNYPDQFPRNRALAGYDIPHNLQLATVYELPFEG